MKFFYFLFDVHNSEGVGLEPLEIIERTSFIVTAISIASVFVGILYATTPEELIIYSSPLFLVAVLESLRVVFEKQQSENKTPMKGRAVSHRRLPTFWR